MAFDAATPIAAPDGWRRIDSFIAGDQVMAGSRSATGGTQLTWSPVKVSFSQGTGESDQTMMYLRLGDGGGQSFTCSLGQPLLLFDGKLARAESLRPNQQLVDRGGNPVLVQKVSLGEFKGGVNIIATDAPWTGSPEGHFVLAAGVVTGDYTLELHFDQLPAESKQA